MATFPHKKEQILQVLGFLNSIVAAYYLTFLSPTVAVNAGEIGRLPLLECRSENLKIDEAVEECIDISNADWDSFETSCCYKPFVVYSIIQILSPRPRNPLQINSLQGVFILRHTRKYTLMNLNAHYL